MADTFYVQTQARRIHRSIHAPQQNIAVCAAYLQGASAASFRQGYGALRALLERYYAQAALDPASLGLPLYGIDRYRNMSKEARDGNQALMDFPITLFALGKAGSPHGEALSVEQAAWKDAVRAVKGRRMPAQINWLAEHGFTFSQWNGKTFPSKLERVEVTHVSDPAIFLAMRALGDKLFKHRTQVTWSGLPLLDQFIALDPALFADDTATIPPKTLAHFQQVVGDEIKDVLTEIVERFAARGLTLRMDVSYVKNRFFDPKGKDTLNHIEYGDYRSGREGNETLALRLKLNNPDAYIDRVSALPAHLKAPFTDAWCGNCVQNCNRRITYTLDGEERRACGCFFFLYRNPRREDLDTLMALYDAEQDARAGKKRAKGR